MITKKRKFIAIVCSFVLMTACAIFTSFSTKTVSASNSPLQMIGAEVRVDENHGIRFVAKVTEPAEDSKYYVMIAPAAWVDGKDLSDGNTNDYYDEFTKANKEFINLECTPVPVDENKDDTTDYYIVRGTISRVKYNNTNRQFFGVAYEEKADGTRVYASNQSEGIRSCVYVAGTALNTGVAENNDTAASILNTMINNAYNKVVLGKSEMDEQEEAVFALPEIPAYNSVGTELDFCVNGAEGLDLPAIEWNVEKAESAQSIFDKNNKLVIFDNEGTIKVSTKVAGQTLVANVNCGTYLETFENADNIKAYNQFNASATAGTWLESLTDDAGATEYGVGMGSTKFTGNGSDGIAVRFNKTEAELKAILGIPNFQSITFRVLIKDEDANGTMSINFFNLISRTVTENRWTKITITKDDIFENETLLTEFVNAQGIIDGIAKNFDADGSGYMKGSNGTTNRRLVYVPNNNASPLVARELYIADIEFTFGEETYLETFSSSANNIRAAGQFTATNGVAGNYLDSYTDKDGVTEYGIGKAARDSGGRVCVRFDKSEEELRAILNNANFEKITFRILVTATDVADGGSVALKFLNTVNKTAIANQWIDLDLTRAEIFNDTLVTAIGSEEKVMDSANGSLYGFVNAFSSSGMGYIQLSSASGNAAYRMIHTAVKGLEVYIDHVTYTLASAN